MNTGYSPLQCEVRYSALPISEQLALNHIFRTHRVFSLPELKGAGPTQAMSKDYL